MAGASLIRCDAGDFERLRPRLSGWGDVLHDELRSELGSAARAAAGRAARNALRSQFPPKEPATRPWPHRSTGLRAGLAARTTVAVHGVADGVECVISNAHPLALQTNGSKRWDHPVLGNRRAWRGQEGSRWWSRAMDESRPAMAQAADRALTQALRRL